MLLHSDLHCTVQARAAASINNDNPEAQAQREALKKKGAEETRLAEACLSAASSDIPIHDKIKKIKQARKHLALASMSYTDCDAEEEMQSVLQHLEKRIKDAELSAANSDKGMSALKQAEHAIEQERWGDVEEACARAVNAFEDTGEMGQIFVIEELKKRASVAKAKAVHRDAGEKAGRTAKAAYADGRLDEAAEYVKRSRQEYAKSGAAIPKQLLSVFDDISKAQNDEKKLGWVKEGDQSLALAETLIASQAAGDAGVALMKARECYKKADALDMKESLLAKLEQCIRDIADKTGMKNKGLQLLAQAEVAYAKTADMYDKDKLNALTEAATLAINAWASLNQGGAAEADLKAASELKARVKDEREKYAARQRCIEALSQAQSCFEKGEIPAAQMYVSTARSELECCGRGMDLVTRLDTIESRIKESLQAQDVKKSVHEALEAARTALELSQLPGRREKVAHARIHVDAALQALHTAGIDVQQQLGDEVRGMSERIREAEKWAGGCTEGDRLLELARGSMEEGSLDEAAGHCRAAITAYTQANALTLVQEAQQVSKQVECAQYCAEGASELADAASALEERDLDEATNACTRARTYFERADAREHMHEVDAMERDIQLAREQYAAEKEGLGYMEHAEAAIQRGDTQAARSQLQLANGMFSRAGNAIRDAYMARLQAVEAELQNAEGTALQDRQAEEYLHAAEAALVRGDVVAARFDATRAKEHACSEALCTVAEALLIRVALVEGAIQARALGEQTLTAAERAIGANNHSEALSLLKECRKAYTQAGKMCDAQILRVCTSMYTCLHLYVFVCVCMCVHRTTYAYVCIHTYIHTKIHDGRHAYTYAYVYIIDTHMNM
jgi:hypothetical protein